MALRIASWNVNSLRQRLDHLARFNREIDPHVVCLQETKVLDALFPQEELQAMGFAHLLFHGQKSYNGVAILSKQRKSGATRMTAATSRSPWRTTYRFIIFMFPPAVRFPIPKRTTSLPISWPSWRK